MNQFPGSIALLPTRTNIDLGDPLTNEYFDTDMIAYVLADLRGRPRRVIGGAGSQPYGDMQIGASRHFHHDQAGYDFGLLKVVGWLTAEERHGELPTRKLPYGVFK